MKAKRPSDKGRLRRGQVRNFNDEKQPENRFDGLMIGVATPTLFFGPNRKDPRVHNHSIEEEEEE